MQRNYHAANASVAILRIKTHGYGLQRRIDVLAIVNPASHFCELDATKPEAICLQTALKTTRSLFSDFPIPLIPQSASLSTFFFPSRLPNFSIPKP